MARAKRHFVPGYVWHITQRCHKKEFLLKFNIDRRKWLHWMFQANRRFRISILNYTVTSNHIHMLAMCDREQDAISRSIHLAAGRTAAGYNQRKERSGAFWEGPFHATAVETDKHLIHCMVYIDMNMVRAGVVNHPEEWPYCGYHEIMDIRQRYTMIDKEKLNEILDLNSSSLKDTYNSWIEDYLNTHMFSRESRWTESIAVGSQNFIELFQAKLGGKIEGRKILESSGSFKLRETRIPYIPISPIKTQFKR